MAVFKSLSQIHDVSGQENSVQERSDVTTILMDQISNLNDERGEFYFVKHFFPILENILDVAA